MMDLQVQNIGNYLENKKIAIAVSGGIAAIEVPKLARHLRRYGADVKIYTTNEALKFVGKAALEWGAEKAVVSELSGMAEHICLEDLVLVAPATLNTVNKIFSGIADNPVTTLVASALGMKKPVYLAPTMHDSLFENPFFQENLQKAESYGLSIVPPRVEEGKRKMPHLDEIAARISRELSKDRVKGRKILITGGPTPGRIDDVRIITNIFRGGLAVKIAKEAYFRGADVKLLLGKNSVMAPTFINTRYHRDFYEYRENVLGELRMNYDAGIFSAAVADYIPEYRPGKIASRGGIKSIELKETAKIIEEVREKYPSLYMVTFKYEVDVTKEQLLEIAMKRSEKYDLVVANRSQDMGEKKHEAYIVRDGQVISKPATKEAIAAGIIDLIGASAQDL